MAANLSIARAKVTTSDGDVLDGVGVMIRLNTLTLRRGREVVRTEPVSGVVRAGGRNKWIVTLGDGSTWNVDRVGGCGCGG